MNTTSLLIPITLFVYLIVRRIRQRSLGRTPPGPKGWPIIGNICDIPRKKSWLTYVEWSKTYGDIVYVEPFGSPTVILNNPDDLRELLDKRSIITSSRPRQVMANELMGWGWDFVHMPQNDYWRQHRKVFHRYFQQKNLPNYYPVIRKASNSFLDRLVMSPNNFRAHIRQFAGTVILKLTYDHEVASENDHYVALAGRAIGELIKVRHIGSSIVDIIPALKYVPAWFPGASFKKEAQISVGYAGEMRDVPFLHAKERIASDTIEPCFVSDSLEKAEADEEIIKNAAGIAYLAGSDTSVSVIEFFFLAMLHYPEAQICARREIDEVTRGMRLPDFDDRSSLPYIDLILAELFRWAPPGPLGVSHQSQEPDTYKGYYFPAGTTFIPNVYGVFHDETRFPEPEKFKPERFLGANAGDDPFSMGSFGFGRRICPGRYLADASTWLIIAQVLTTFNIQPKQDSRGKEVLPPPEYTGGLISHPAPFEVNIVPRSAKMVEIVQHGLGT